MRELRGAEHISHLSRVRVLLKPDNLAVPEIPDVNDLRVERLTGPHGA
jgi:hypothetical protein